MFRFIMCRILHAVFILCGLFHIWSVLYDVPNTTEQGNIYDVKNTTVQITAIKNTATVRFSKKCQSDISICLCVSSLTLNSGNDFGSLFPTYPMLVSINILVLHIKKLNADLTVFYRVCRLFYVYNFSCFSKE